jgi:hypothetical protein
MKNKYTRREALELGLGTVGLATSATAFSVAQTAKKSIAREENRVPAVDTFNKYGEELEISLILRTSPVAVKMLEKDAEIPKEAFRPKRDGGYHIAQCQAFGLSRREGKTVAMLKEDHWCPTALMAYGMVEKPDSMAMWGESFLSFEAGKYIGIVTAPLKSATFMPDVVLIYSNPAQLRGLLLPMMYGGAFLPSILCALRRGSCRNRKLLRCASRSGRVSESVDAGRRDDICRTAGKDAGDDGRFKRQGRHVLPSQSVYGHAAGF